MRTLLARSVPIVAFLCVTALLASQVDSQARPPAVGPPPTPAADPAPQVPQGVEVMAHGPIHEAFAAPSIEAKATEAIAKKPPAPIEEMPPEDRPEGDVVWVGGYWAYEDDRQDFLWVSGCWRVKPESREWVPGYWREVGDQWQWVAGFWTGAAPVNAAGPAQAQEVTYYPQPPAPPNLAPPPPNVTAQGSNPGAEMFFVPGYWQWTGTHYVWRPGYWQRVRTGYVYIAPRYYWTPTGYVFVPGYWDYTVARRGVIFAPVVYNPAVVPVAYVYSPAYAVSDVLVLDAMFVNPGYGHYYFGNYYGPAYANRGYVTTVVYSRTYYEPIVVYQRWEYRDNPRWFDVQVNLVFERNAGRAPLPARTLVEQQRIIVNNTTNNYYTTVINNTTINNKTVINQTALMAPAKTVMAARGIPSTRIDTVTRTQIKQTSHAVQVAAATERKRTELAPIPPGSQGKPITRSMPVRSTPVAPKAPAAATGTHPNNVAPASGSALGPTSPTNTKTGSTTPTQSGTTQPTHPGNVSAPPHTGQSGTPPRPLPPLKKTDEKKKDKQ
jgi:WXXGXW repeat (2 copies)